MIGGRRSVYVLALVAVAVVSFAIAGCTGKSSTESTTTATATSSAPGASPSASGATLPPESWVVPVDVSPSPSASSSPNPTQSDWENLGWKTFVALNWPSQTPPPGTSVIGLPDTSQTIGASANGAMIPTVWLTYRSEATTMLADAQDPGPWGSIPPSAPSCPSSGSSSPSPSSDYPVAPGFQPMTLSMVSKFNPNGANNVDEASGPPLIAQNGWYVTYDIRISQSEYTYIQSNGYYNGSTQAQQEAAHGSVAPFPRTGTETMFPSPLPSAAQFGALEVKSAWRVLDPVNDRAIIPRYYTQTGYFLQQDGVTCQGPALFGLIGFHILRLTPTTPATWFWATFEQVDNVVSPPVSPAPSGSPPAPTLAKPGTPNGNCNSPSPSPYNSPPGIPNGNIPWNGNNTPVNVCMVTPISDAVQQVNRNWQSMLAGTVWANYQMIDTINPAVQGQPSPVPTIAISSAGVNTNILANTALETYMQGNGPGNGQSCMDCHAFGAPQGAPSNSTNQIFTFVLGNAATPAPTSSPGVTAVHGRTLRNGSRLPRHVIDLIHRVYLRK